MDTLRLRTLTEKSIFGFGKYYDLPVKYCLDNNLYRYLRWVYFNCSMISFMPNILDQIHIPKEYRIEKPGKNEKYHNEVCEILNKKIPGFSKFKQTAHNKKVKKGKLVCKTVADNLKHSKANLQRLNQGH